ncbi:MAG: hypothetical protein RLZZ511_1005 [Cyanobacteriota bacterium]|jgi:hypothetical protein
MKPLTTSAHPSPSIPPFPKCCKALWSVLRTNITPTQLAPRSLWAIATIAQQFGEYFECEAPTVEQIQAAMVYDRPEVIDQTLFRWPIVLIDEN